MNFRPFVAIVMQFVVYTQDWKRHSNTTDQIFSSIEKDDAIEEYDAGIMVNIFTWR